MFLLAHFIQQLIHFFLISVFKVKNSVFSSKTCSLLVWNMFNQILSQSATMFLFGTLYTTAHTIISCFNFSGEKQRFFNPKLGSLPVRNVFNHILPKLAIMFLFLPFTLLLIQLFPISISMVKNNIFRPKIYFSSRSEHVQPNFVKLGNIKYKNYTMYNAYFMRI